MARLFTSASSHNLQYGGGVVTVHSPLTIAAWIKPSTIVAHAVIGFVGTYATNTDFACLVLGPTSGVAARTSVGSYVDSINATAVPTTSWSHAAAVFTNATSRMAYLNGVAGTINTTSKSLTHSAYNRTGIGAKVNNNPETWYFNGLIGEICMWNVALTAAEILRLSQREQPMLVRSSNIVGYWPLHGMPGAVEPDMSGTAGPKNMAVTGAVAGAHPPLPLHQVGSVWVPSTSVSVSTFDLDAAEFVVAVAVGVPVLVADLAAVAVVVPVVFGGVSLVAVASPSALAVPVSFGSPSLGAVVATPGLGVAVSFGAATLSAAPSGGVLATDTFTRTLVDSWGTADLGGAWTVRQGVAGDYDVNSGVGIIDMHASGTRSVTLPLSVADVDITVKATWDVQSANLLPLIIMARWASATSHYYAQLGHSAVGTIRLLIGKFDGTAVTLVGPITVTSSHTLGQWWWVRFQVEGTALRARAWLDGSAEPSTWLVTVTDAILGSPGAIGLRAGGATLQTFVRYDSLNAATIGAAPGGPLTATGLSVPVSFGSASLTVAAVYASGFTVPFAAGQAQFAIGATGFEVPVAVGSPSLVARLAATGFLCPVAFGVTGFLVLVSPSGLGVPWASGFDHDVIPVVFLYVVVDMESVDLAVELESVDLGVTLEAVDRAIELV